MNFFSFARRRAQGLYLLALCVALLLPLAIQWLLWGWSTAGALSSVASAALLFLLLYRRSPLILGAVLAVWGIVQTAGVELVLAVGRMPSITDVVYLVDPTMVRNSLHGSGLARPDLLAALLLWSVGAVALRLVSGPLSPLPLLRRGCWVLLLLFPLHGMARQLDLAAAPWKQFGIFHKLAAETVSHLSLADEAQVMAQANLHAAALSRLDLTGQRLIGQGKAKNVLLVVLEGVSGAYLDQIRESLGYKWDQHLMPRLSRLAREQKAMHTADFVVHNHQTIRGLYALLCGDYPKLDFSTPKAMELLALKDHDHICLPAQLAGQGFDTTFLQAADLAFMSKDKVMPRMGFHKTVGPEGITGPPEQAIPWGWDDRAFFNGALKTVQGMRQQKAPWFLTLLTVGTHQPYGAPKSYLERYANEKVAAMAYLDDAVSDFLTRLDDLGVMEDTLVIVTSDESHGTDDLRLANAWGLNLVFAPERETLPVFKQGVYGHIDMAASILDYLALPINQDIGGRSFFRDYAHGREMISYTNGILRHLNSAGHLVECDFQQVCREYDQGFRFMVPQAAELSRYSGTQAHQETALAQVLNHSLSLSDDEQNYLFANGDRRKLKATIVNDWTDNLIGAQYLDFGQGTRTTVTLRIKAVQTDTKGASLRLSLKEYDQDSAVQPPKLPLLHEGEEMAITFDIDNPAGRRAFSFHLLGEGLGEIEIGEFRVNTHRLSATGKTKKG